MEDKEAVAVVWAQLQATPGANLRQLHLRTGLPPVGVSRAVRVLLRQGRVREETQKKSRRLYPKGTARSPKERRLLAYVNQPRARRIIDMVLRNPDIRQKEVADALGLAPPAVAYWLHRFEDAGILEVDRRGTECHYRMRDPPKVERALRLVDEKHVMDTSS